jgi:hypothetical protein
MPTKRPLDRRSTIARNAKRDANGRILGKLTPEDVKTIRELRKSGIKPGKLAEMFHVGPQHIWQIMNGICHGSRPYGKVGAPYRIDASIISAARSSLAAGMRPSLVAKRWGISVSLVNVLKRDPTVRPDAPAAPRPPNKRPATAKPPLPQTGPADESGRLVGANRE